MLDWGGGGGGLGGGGPTYFVGQIRMAVEGK